MAWAFADSLDCYATGTDVLGFWDAVTGTPTILAGRFAGSQAFYLGASSTLTKSSGLNEAFHKFNVAFRQTAAISGTNIGFNLQLLDGVTGQCAVAFRADGAILLTSGTSLGTVLATYTGAVPTSNVWYAFEIEVLISSTAGYMNVRRNGNTVNDFTSATNLNTRVSANNYANKLTVGHAQAVNQHNFDDLYWRSDASSVAWMGDVKCVARAPASDAAVQFSRTPTGVLTQTVPVSAPTTGGGAAAVYTLFTAAYSGTVTAAAVSVSNATGSTLLKCAIFADNGSNGPGAVLASADAAVSIITGSNAFTFTSGVPVVKGTKYWVGALANGSSNYNVASSSSIGATGAAASYPAFPQASPVVTNPAVATQMMWTYTATPANWQAVAEAQQDATTSYVYDSVPGHADFYTIAPIASTPLVTHAVVTRAYMIKSDAGTRTAAVQLKSGGTTDASPTLVLTPSNWQWAWKHYPLDPATGAAWTAAAVNVCNIGPLVVA